MKKIAAVLTTVASLAIATPAFACPMHDKDQQTAETKKADDASQQKTADKAKDAKPADKQKPAADAGQKTASKS